MCVVWQEYPPSPSELQAAADGLANDPARLHTLSADFSTVALSPGAPAYHVVWPCADGLFFRASCLKGSATLP